MNNNRVRHYFMSFDKLRFNFVLAPLWNTCKFCEIGSWYICDSLLDPCLSPKLSPGSMSCFLAKYFV